MSDREVIDQIVEILRKVPEKKLLIIELANSIPMKYGGLDVEAVREMQPQITLAVHEAKAYSERTAKAVASLVKLPEASTRIRPATLEDIEEAFLEL